MATWELRLLVTCDSDTGPYAAAMALDTLMDNVLSTPGILEDTGILEVGEFNPVDPDPDYTPNP